MMGCKLSYSCQTSTGAQPALRMATIHAAETFDGPILARPEKVVAAALVRTFLSAIPALGIAISDQPKEVIPVLVTGTHSPACLDSLDRLHDLQRKMARCFPQTSAA